MIKQIDCDVSIIIPAYNMGLFLRRCLDSVLEQTLESLEVIVVDDGSKDNTKSIIQEYQLRDERIIGIFKKNGGVTSARFAGVQKASGKYLFFLDGDDYLPNTALATLFHEAEKNDNEIVFGLFTLVYENECRVYRVEDFGRISNTNYLKLLSTGKAPWQLCAKLIKRDLFQLASIKVPEDLAVGEDALTLFQLVLEAKNVAMVNDVVYCYTQRKNSVMHSKNLKLANDNLRSAELIVEQMMNKGFTIGWQTYFLALRLLFLLMAFQKAYLNVDYNFVRNVLDLYRKDKTVLMLFPFYRRIKIWVLIYIYKIASVIK